MVGPNNPHWKGGRFVDGTKGYVYVQRPDHPRASTGGYVAEHSIVMERIIGRILLPGETVHHRNGVRDDNRPENLELWAKPQPPGCRALDLLEWAEQVVATYGPLRSTLTPEATEE